MRWKLKVETLLTLRPQLSLPSMSVREGGTAVGGDTFSPDVERRLNCGTIVRMVF
jgi:hypothetical protein